MEFMSHKEARKRRKAILDHKKRKRSATYGDDSNKFFGDLTPNHDEVGIRFGIRTPLGDISNIQTSHRRSSNTSLNYANKGTNISIQDKGKGKLYDVDVISPTNSAMTRTLRISHPTMYSIENKGTNISSQDTGKGVLYDTDLATNPIKSVMMTPTLRISHPTVYPIENTYPFLTPNSYSHLSHNNFMTPSLYYTRVMMSPDYSTQPSYVSFGNQFSTGFNSSFNVHGSSNSSAKEARRLRREILNSKKSGVIQQPPTGISTSSTIVNSNVATSHTYGAKNVRGKRFSMSNLRPIALNLDNEPLEENINPNHRGISNEYIDDGDPVYECGACGALMWYEETLRGATNGKNGAFSLCCTRGKISLPVFPKDPPPLLMNLYTNNHPKSKHFIENVRRYNSMFSFTSMGGRIDHKPNKGRGPYIFRLQGENCHRMGGLVPNVGYKPQFSQLYIFDTTNEVQHRMNAVSSNKASSSNTSPNDSHSSHKPQPLDRDLVRELKQLLDECNNLVKVFRMARDRYVSNPHQSFRLKLISNRVKDGRNYNLPTAPEIAALVPGDIDLQFDRRDIMIESHDGHVRRISELHPQYLALQYPLLFAYAEDGYRIDIPHNDVEEGSNKRQKKVTMREFFAYMIQQRPRRPNLLLKARKLLQQFLVDAYTMIESERISYIRNNQGNLRRESFDKLCKAAREGNTETTYMGTRVLLPSSFTGSSRYMVQNYLDAMALCKRFGYPDIFITFTCNPKWPELIRILENEKLSPEDRADLIARMFKIKLDRLMKSIRDDRLFGRLEAYVYTVEFQKRGLPHAHICLFLHEDDKLPNPSDIDRYICAELPDKELEPALYKLVGDFMMHGPCGEANLSSPCMNEKKCTKNFPKKFVDQTSVDNDGFPVYRRRDNGRTVTKNRSDLDNRYVVGHNSLLLKQFQAHINVEWCNQLGSIKYLFKYINKGPDRVTAAVCDEEKDEIKDFFDCRYVSSCEAVWRMYSFDIHKRHPSVMRLPFHLPNEQSVIFDGDTLVDYVLEDPSVNSTKFLEWMNCNKENAEARELTYVQFPWKFTWKQDKKKWFRRRRESGGAVGRIHHVSPSTGQLFYLRILLNIVKGPTSYEDIKTVNGVVCESYKEACYQLGLLDDDNEYIACIKETHKSASGPFLRNLFVMLLLSDSLIKPEDVWTKTWELLSEDLENRERRIHKAPSLKLTPSEKQNLALDEIQQMLLRHGRSLNDFDHMPCPVNTTNLHYTGNTLISDETMLYDTIALTSAHESLYHSLTEEQRKVYHTIMNAVDRNEGGVFFLYGFGGTGKTFVWKTLSAKIRSSREIVLNVASSGIASLLLEGGRTAHSRFAIPININENSFCCIRPDSDLAGLLRKTKLIIWDEAPMIHKHSFEALDRTLRDIIRESNPNSMNMPFGGKVVVFGGDFRQVLPVIPNASRQDIVNASLKSSYIWNHCKLLTLTRNMRLEVGQDSANIEEIKAFGEWILKIGDGKINEPNDGEAEVEIPDDIVIKDTTDPIASIVDAIYPNIKDNLSNLDYFQDRAILAPTHEVVDKINDHVMQLIDGEEKIYLSSDSICASEGEDFNKEMYSPDYLNGIRVAGLPNHQLVLKPGVPVMLIRNINQPAGLCNGTRLKVVKLGERVIEAKIISGSNIGQTTFIPRMRLSPSDKRIPFKLQRRQFPLTLCFAMTINKSQGQTLSHVGLFLKKPVFSHGQLYVALSRVKSKKGLKVMICDDEGKATNKTTNVVFKEVLRNL